MRTSADGEERMGLSARSCVQVFAGDTVRGLLLGDGPDQVSLLQEVHGGHLSLRKGDVRADLKRGQGRSELDLASALGGAKVLPGTVQAIDASGVPRVQLDGVSGEAQTAPVGTRVLRPLD